MFAIAERIVSVPVGNIREDKDRLRLHASFDPRGQDAGLVASIRQFGLLLPLLVDDQNVLLKGHRRLAAARFLGLTHVNVIVLQTGERSDVFHTLFLSRHVKVYAKCVMRRAQIEELVDLGEQLRARDASQDEREELEDAWVILCDTLQSSKDTLRKGVALLRRFDELRATGNKDDFDLANKAEAMFREKSYNAAMRVLNEQADDDIADDAPDCRMAPVPRNRQPREVAAPPALAVYEEPEDEEQVEQPSQVEEVFRRFNSFLAVYVTRVGTLTAEDHAAVAHFRERIGAQFLSVVAA